MKRPSLPPQDNTRARNFWKPWKWIGLGLYAAVLLFKARLPGPIIAVGYLYGIVVIANLLFHLFRYLKDRFFWRVRNRLIGAFVFVGVIPLLLLLGVAYLSGYLLLGQLAGYYLDNSLRGVEHQLSEINVELAGQVSSTSDTAAFKELAAQILSFHASRFPRLSARLLRRLPGGSLEMISKYDPHGIVKDHVPYPGDKWLEGHSSFEGILRDGQAALLTSLQPVPKSPGLYTDLTAPLDNFLEERLQREQSVYFTLFGTGESNVSVSSGGVQVTIGEDDGSKSRDPAAEKQIKQKLSKLEVRRQGDLRRMVSWFTMVKGRNYETGKEELAGFAVLYVPREKILKTFLGQDDVQGRIVLKGIYVLAGMFAFVELVSLIIGFTISRRVTRSVQDMYQGTLALQKGDLRHKIPERRKDQLGLLAYSFNQMSASITRLLDEVSEKKRLEQELEIAREVQATLFPKQLPHPRGMAVFGGCEPARVVSGDYYDFIVEDEARLDIVVGDISGKGISAALLMANLQAAMRNQLLSVKHDNPADVEKSLAKIMAQLNQQVYLNSPSEKYATLFLSRYDAEKRRLSYCNAGHLPPILLHEQGTEMLEATGMVVGLFPGAAYEAKSIELSPESMLAIFTDGVTEAVNKDDEEFGQERLLEALRQFRTRTPDDIFKFVVAKVHEWQGDLPQHDDITLIVAKVD
jgi:sigma-B regulation protein RsbU (phosphoserine phosphatase)